MPVNRSIRIVKTPSNFCPFGTRYARKPARITSPPIAPPGITNEKKNDCVVRENAEKSEQGIAR